MFPLLSHNDSRRNDIHMENSGKYSPAKNEGMNIVRNLPLHRAAVLGFVSVDIIPSTRDIVAKTNNLRSRQKNVIPCEP